MLLATVVSLIFNPVLWGVRTGDRKRVTQAPFGTKTGPRIRCQLRVALTSGDCGVSSLSFGPIDLKGCMTYFVPKLHPTIKGSLLQDSGHLPGCFMKDEVVARSFGVL